MISLANTYYGVVEDRNDPLEIGRVRVRIVGLHSHDKTHIPTETLPWAAVLMPNTSASNSGVGSTPGLTVGSTVLVGFLDGEDMQTPFVLGTFIGIQSDVAVTVNGVKLSQENESAGYRSTVDPSYAGQSDISRAGRSGVMSNPMASLNVKTGLFNYTTPEDNSSKRQYPLNQVRQSEAGHIEEWDNTPGNERIKVVHKSGTASEINASGDSVRQVVGSNFEIFFNDNNVYIEGACNVYVNGNCNVSVKGNATTEVKGDYTVHSAKTILLSGKEIKLNAEKAIDIKSFGAVNIGTEQDVIIAGKDVSLSVAGDLKTDVVGSVEVNVGADIQQSVTGNVVTVANGGMMMAATEFLSLKSAAEVMLQSTLVNVNATGNLNLTTNQNVNVNGGTANINASTINMSSDAMNLNNGPAASYGKVADIAVSEVAQVRLTDFHPYDKVVLPNTVITATEPVLNEYSTQQGTTSESGYKEWVQNSDYSWNDVSGINTTRAQYSANGSSTSVTGSKRHGYAVDTSGRYKNHPGAGDYAWENPTIGAAVKSLLAFISKGEGGYNAANDGTEGGRIVGSTQNKTLNGKPLVQCTIAEIVNAQNNGLFAVGRYQIIPVTLRSVLAETGISHTELFDQLNQDKLGLALLIGKKRPALAAYLRGHSDDEFSAGIDFSKEWASIPRPDTNQSFYPLPNKSSHQWEEVAAVMREARKELSNPAPASTDTFYASADPKAKTAGMTAGQWARNI